MKLAHTAAMRRLEADAVAIGMGEGTLMELAGYNIATSLLRTEGAACSPVSGFSFSRAQAITAVTDWWLLTIFTALE